MLTPMLTHVSISNDVSAAEAAEITKAFEKGGDVVVCHAICRTRPGRVTMLRSLMRAGVPPLLAHRCGWAVAEPAREPAAPVEPPEPPEPAPTPAPPKSRRSGGRKARSEDAGSSAD